MTSSAGKRRRAPGTALTTTGPAAAPRTGPKRARRDIARLDVVESASPVPSRLLALPKELLCMVLAYIALDQPPSTDETPGTRRRRSGDWALVMRTCHAMRGAASRVFNAMPHLVDIYNRLAGAREATPPRLTRLQIGWAVRGLLVLERSDPARMLDVAVRSEGCHEIVGFLTAHPRVDLAQYGSRALETAVRLGQHRMVAALMRFDFVDPVRWGSDMHSLDDCALLLAIDRWDYLCVSSILCYWRPAMPEEHQVVRAAFRRVVRTLERLERGEPYEDWIDDAYERDLADTSIARLRRWPSPAPDAATPTEDDEEGSDVEQPHNNNNAQNDDLDDPDEDSHESDRIYLRSMASLLLHDGGLTLAPGGQDAKLVPWCLRRTQTWLDDELFSHRQLRADPRPAPGADLASTDPPVCVIELPRHDLTDALWERLGRRTERVYVRAQPIGNAAPPAADPAAVESDGGE